MKIILVHKFFKYTGGADVFFFEVSRILKENGHDVAFFSTLDKDNLESEYSKYFIEAPNFKSRNLITKMLSFIYIPYNFKAKTKFRKLIFNFKPDLIHVFGIGTHISPSILDVAKAHNIPTIISCNDYKHICPNYKLFHHGIICEDCKGGKFYNCITNKCCHDSLTFSFANSIESYIHHFLNIYKKNINLFLFASDFMAIKTEDFWGKGSFKWGKLLNPFQIPELINLNHNGQYGLYFGRLIDEKGVNSLLKALENCIDIPFKIVGDGPDLEKLKHYVLEKHLLNVEFVGAVWGNMLNELLINSKFIVVPSIWHENFPYVILQAFAAGKPVIGSIRGGIPELIIDNERGLLYNIENPKELSEKISLLFNDDEKCLRMGTNARKYIEETFTDEAFYNSLMNNYNTVLK